MTTLAASYNTKVLASVRNIVASVTPKAETINFECKNGTCLLHASSASGVLMAVKIPAFDTDCHFAVASEHLKGLVSSQRVVRLYTEDSLLKADGTKGYKAAIPLMEDCVEWKVEQPASKDVIGLPKLMNIVYEYGMLNAVTSGAQVVLSINKDASGGTSISVYDNMHFFYTTAKTETDFEVSMPLSYIVQADKLSDGDAKLHIQEMSLITFNNHFILRQPMIQLLVGKMEAIKAYATAEMPLVCSVSRASLIGALADVRTPQSNIADFVCDNGELVLRSRTNVGYAQSALHSKNLTSFDNPIGCNLDLLADVLSAIPNDIEVIQIEYNGSLIRFSCRTPERKLTYGFVSYQS